MPRIFRRFPSQIVAAAFVEGVELVNDSALTVVQTSEDAESDAALPWLVELEDSDADEDDASVPGA